MKRRRPSIFVGSSTEAREVVDALQANLDDTCEVEPWHQNIFSLSEGSLDGLLRKAGDFDFAILVVTADDLIESRGVNQASPRDNVLLELGVFIGVLGIKRTFVVFDRTSNIKVPSDLAGLTLASFQRFQSGNLEASLGAATRKIKNAINRVGLREREVMTPGGARVIRALHHVSLAVRDLRRSTEFYGRTLELESLARPDEFSFPGAWFALPNGQELHLIEARQGFPKRTKKINPRKPHFALEVKDFQAANRFLVRKGIEILTEPMLVGSLQSYFHDPDGYIIEVIQPGAPVLEEERLG